MNFLKNNSITGFTHVAFKNGRIPARRLFLFFIYYLRAIITFPFALLQYLLFKKKIRNTKIYPHPIFILGHYRSGTTLLHKLMSSDKRFGHLTAYDNALPNINLILGKRLKNLLHKLAIALKIKNHQFNNRIHQLDDTGEEDWHLVSQYSPYSVYWGYVFPKNARKLLNEDFENESLIEWGNTYLNLVKKISFQNSGKQLILKNPPNTGRVSRLIKMFPNAKFIYIQRNPYHVFYSMKRLWSESILKHHALQSISEQEVDDVILSHYSQLLEKYEQDKKRIPEENLIEIEYEKLEADPFEQIKQVYIKLNLPDFSETEEELIKRLNQEKKYKKFDYTYSSADLEKIEQHWGSIIKKYAYETPDLDFIDS